MAILLFMLYAPLELKHVLTNEYYDRLHVEIHRISSNGVFCAGGDSAFDMYGNIGAMWCFSLPLSFLAAFVWRLSPVAVYCIMNLDEIVKIPAVYLRYKKYIWLRDLTREKTEIEMNA